jgi:TPR repeat protein
MKYIIGNFQALCLYLLMAFAFNSAQALSITDLSLENLKYDVFQGKELAIDKLIGLAQRGDPSSQIYLADYLVEKGNLIDRNKALFWYKTAFKQGQGDITVLKRIVRLSGVIELERKKIIPWLAIAITKFDFYASTLTVDTLLEVFYYFPELFEIEKVMPLILSHQASCIELCLADLYKARLLEHNNDDTSALEIYRKAVKVDSRAVHKYFALLKDDRNSKFRQLAKELESAIDELTPDTTVAIGENLINLVEYDDDGKPIHDPKVDFWLDSGVRLEVSAAYKSKIQYIFLFPSLYTANILTELIELYAVQNKLWAEYYLGLSYTVLEWRNINPTEARATFDALIIREFWPAYLGLANLKSKGMEDEVDHVKAIEIYELASQKGITSADYQTAVIYGRSKGICRDYVKAYAHNSLAINNGIIAAISYQDILKTKLSDTELVLANKYAEQLAKAREK